MQINQDFTIQKVGDSYVAVPVGKASQTLHIMIHLNETGAFLWNIMAKKDCSEEELVEALLAEYDVEREIAVHDVHALVEQLREKKVFA